MIKYTILLLTILQIKSDCGTLNDSRCQGCEVAETCSSCWESYWDATKKACVVPPNKIAGCRNYKNENTCEDCHLGYYEKSENKCELITVANCWHSEKADECMVCKDGYKPSADKKSCTDTKCEISNCLYCMSLLTTEMCAYCTDGYAINNTFKGCVSNSKDCAALSATGTCNRCKHGHYMNKNECVDSDLIIENFGDDSDDVKKLVIFAFGVLALFF